VDGSSGYERCPLERDQCGFRRAGSAKGASSAGSRTVSASVARPRLPLARDSTPGPIPFALIVEPIGGRSPRHPRLWWSRPMPADVCSMFARTPRYAPAPSGIRTESRFPTTGQNGSSRHVLALHGTSSRRISEQSSGLLIRGFGVQVPGGAPVMTWPYSSRAIRFLSLWGMDGAFLGHARARW
jgi:hypothetical protein